MCFVSNPIVSYEKKINIKLPVRNITIYSNHFQNVKFRLLKYRLL